MGDVDRTREHLEVLADALTLPGGGCPTCSRPRTVGSGRPNGVDCLCGRHFHFGDDLWTRTDACIVCPSCERALSPLDFDNEGTER